MFSLIFITLIASAKCNSLLNIKVETNIDISSQLIYVENSLTIQNNHPQPELSYIYIVDPQLANKIAYITATDDKKQSLNTTEIVTNNNTLKYVVQFIEPLSPAKIVKMHVLYVIYSYLQSYPKTVKQGDKHLVLFNFNVYYYSLYFTQEQSTSLHLGTTEIISINGAQNRSDSSKKGIVYGSYFSKEPMSQFQSIIHFVNPSPFVSVEKLERCIHISHWGFIQIKEDIVMINTAPTFKGPFKRENHLPPDTRIESFVTTLPFDAFDIHLKDEIGYLWSFSINKNDPDQTLVNIKPRFIMYGGWKTRYQISYSLPTGNYISFGLDSTFHLNILLVDKIFPQMFIKEARINIILPEGAIYKYLTPYVELTNNTDKKYCYFLDIICRNIVSFQKFNLIDQHIVNIQLTYVFPQVLLLIKPFIIGVYIYMLFLLFMIFIRHSTEAEIMKNEQIETNVCVEQIRPSAKKIVGQFKNNNKKKFRTKEHVP